MMLLTSNLGNASAHSTKNMPVIFAGGGFKHGQHLGFDQKNNYPLPNLYTSMLQRMGLEIDGFAKRHRNDAWHRDEVVIIAEFGLTRPVSPNLDLTTEQLADR